MSTITREQLRERAREKVRSLEFAVTQTAFADMRAEFEEELELARIALASLEAEAVKRVNADQMHRVCLEANRHLDKYGAMAKEVNKLLRRTAPPAPVVPEVYNIGDATMRHIFTPAGITDVSDMQAVFDQIETVLAGMWQPAPVSLTEEQRAMLRDMDDEIVAELEEEERICRAAMLQGAEPSKMSGIMPDYEGGVMTQRECFQAGWEAHHAAMLRAGAPVQFGWSKGHFGYHALFNAIGKAVNIQGGALSISVSAFEDAMLTAAPQQEVK